MLVGSGSGYWQCECLQDSHATRDEGANCARAERSGTADSPELSVAFPLFQTLRHMFLLGC